MEEEKAAAYYHELAVKGEGAARFKQGLGYGAKPSGPDPGGTSRSIPTSMSNFVRQSSPGKAELLQKEIKVESIRDKLTKEEAEKPERKRDEDIKKPSHRHRSRSPGQGRTKPGGKSDRGLFRREGNRSPGRSGVRRKYSRSRSRSTSRERRREPGRGYQYRWHKRESSVSPGRWRNSHGGHHRRDRSNSPDRDASNRMDGKKCPGRDERNANVTSVKRSLGVSGRRDLSATKDYSALIPGYDDMTPAQKLKAKMRLQLSEAAVKDCANGMTGEWERFDFDKTAPLDDDALLAGYEDAGASAAADDTAFLRHTGSTFLTSSYEARREARIKDAHEAAIFGAPASSILDKAGSKMGTQAVDIHANIEDKPVNLFISDEVVKMQQRESWQERAKRLREERAA